MLRIYSIVISGYKASAITTLRRCFDVLQSAEVRREIVFLDNTRDGCHKPEVESIFSRQSADAKLLYVPCKIRGKVAAQNTGIPRACGEVLVFLDDDVLPEPGLLLEYDKAFQKHRPAAVQGRVVLQFEENKAPTWLNERFRLDLAEMDFGRIIVPFEMGLTGANMAIHRSMFDKYGLFDERLGPGRSGTLEDQEYSERIRRHGELQIFWPGASVWHVIPPSRLRVCSFARIYYDVGYSDFFLSRHLIQGGLLRFSGYMFRQAFKSAALSLWYLVRRDVSMAIWHCCRVFGHYAYWKQGTRSWKEG